jgi:hypothetical protein
LHVEKQRNGPAGDDLFFQLQEVPSHQTCIVVETSSPSGSTEAARFRPDELVLIEQLAALAEDEGISPPQDWPKDVIARVDRGLVVDGRRWEILARSALRSEGRNEESRRKAFQRARDRLLATGAVGHWKAWVWLAAS